MIAGDLAKQAVDLLVGTTLLLLSAPAMGLIALAIKLDDSGPAIYRQERVGRNGRNFICLKFRTMAVGADQRGLRLEIAANDERITRLGRFLRPWALDELPQLFNVLRGDMSLVGPRPTVPSQVKLYDRKQRRRLEVKPGLTGWALVNGRNAIPWSERIELDIWYVDNRSVWLDLRILGRTLAVWLRRTGAADADGRTRGVDW